MLAQRTLGRSFTKALQSQGEEGRQGLLPAKELRGALIPLKQSGKGGTRWPDTAGLHLQLARAVAGALLCCARSWPCRMGLE